MNELSNMTVETMFQIADIMQHNQLLPEHLRGKRNTKTRQWEPFSEVERKSICFSVINAANLFGCNPMQLAEQSYVVHGKLDYSGAYYAALANTRGGLDQKLSYEFTGEGNARQVTVSGRFAGEAMPRVVTMTVAEGLARGGDGWKDDPDQMLCYAGARRWVRRHCPQVLLGLVPPDEDEPAKNSPNPAKLATDSEPPRIGGTAERTAAEWETLIDQAESKGELESLAAKIVDSDLENDEIRLLRERGRQRWRGLSIQARERQEMAGVVAAATQTQYEGEAAQTATETPSRDCLAWEARIREAGSVGQLSNRLAEIEESELPIAERDHLARMISQRIQEMRGDA